jgi:putative heme transporter
MVAIGIAIVIVTFAVFLPKIADYRDVWALVKTLSWGWMLALLAATALNLITFAPPWQVALPGLRFIPAMTVTQASTALSMVVPGGAAVGMAGSYGMLRGLGFEGRSVGRAVTLTGIWNQFANLAYPIVAVFLVSITGGETALLATVAFVGVGILGVAIAGLALVLASRGLASDLGDAAGSATNWALGKLGRGPVTWGGPSFVRFRDETNELLSRRWHLLTLATLAGSLTVFLVLLVSLRAFGVESTEVTVIEAFAAWALARLLGSIPITPGGIGIVELSLTSTLLGFGGPNTGVVAATLVFRFLTMVPTLILGLIAAFVWRHRTRAALP